ncbi:MAG: hypothetical protein NC078_08630 [Ruminococcus sp.]|nr:hypothetical protein [Ruminococcus sp.]
MKRVVVFLMQGLALILALFAVLSSVIVTVDLIGRKNDDKKKLKIR